MPVPADVQLFIFNKALFHLGARKLTSLTEREPGRVLSEIWDGGLRDFCLEQGQFKFAARIAKLDYAPSITPAFGFQFAFAKPDDMIRLTAFSGDERFNEADLNYQDAGLYWMSDLEAIYIKYVSRDLAFGYDLTRWPATFLEYVALVLATRAAPRIKNQTTVDDLEIKAKKALEISKALDAQAEPTKFMPQGRWTRARMGRGSGRMMRRDMT